jgi:hypothetical protein
MLKARLGHDFDERIARAVPFLFHPRVHPNALSVLGVAVSLAGAFAFAEGAFRTGALIVLGGGVFDLVDGVVARRQGRVTAFGGFLDYDRAAGGGRSACRRSLFAPGAADASRASL